MAQRFKCRWRENPPRAISRHDAKPLPVGMNLDEPEQRTRPLACLVCSRTVLVTRSRYDEIERLRLDWTICDKCERESDAFGR